MAQTTGQLGAVNSTVNVWQHAQTTNQLVKEKNRQDTFIPVYAADTGTATAYVMTPTPGIKFYRVGQIFVFKASHANTGTTPTLNVNGWGAGTITKQGGAALAVGDIALNDFVEVKCTSTTPTFQITSQVATPAVLSGATTFLGVDVALNNTGTFFSGPNTGSIGANGQTWLIIATGAYFSSTQDAFEQQIFDGTNAIAADLMHNGGANTRISITNTKVVVLSAATTFTLRAKDQSSINGTLATTGGAGTANIATSITAVRIA